MKASRPVKQSEDGSQTRPHLISDLVAGLTTGISDIPDTMASAVLAGANPVSGLLAIMVGTPIGALFSSSAFMTIAATSGNAEQPVIILRLRAYEAISSTFINVLERYASQVRARGGSLMLAGVSQIPNAQLDRTEITQETLGEENIFVATENVSAATKAAWIAGQAWLEEQLNLS